MASHHRQMTNEESLTVNGLPQSTTKMNTGENSVLELPTQFLVNLRTIIIYYIYYLYLYIIYLFISILFII